MVHDVGTNLAEELPLETAAAISATADCWRASFERLGSDLSAECWRARLERPRGELSAATCFAELLSISFEDSFSLSFL